MLLALVLTTPSSTRSLSLHPHLGASAHIALLRWQVPKGATVAFWEEGWPHSIS